METIYKNIHIRLWVISIVKFFLSKRKRFWTQCDTRWTMYMLFLRESEYIRVFFRIYQRVRKIVHFSSKFKSNFP